MTLADHLYHSPIARWMSMYSRRSKIHLLDSLLRPGDLRILDVGTGSEDDIARNVLFEELERRPNIQLTGLVYDEPLGNVRSKYPRARFVTGNGTALPFVSDSFDVAHSNAVIEHVIGVELRTALVSEMLRVAPLVFIATPNKYFPIEVHTRLPFIHWLPTSIHNAVVRRSGSRAIRGAYYEPLAPSDLRGLFPRGVHVTIKMPGVPGMTVVAIGERAP